MLIDEARADKPAAVVIPLDAGFAARAEAATRLWRTVTARPISGPSERLPEHRRRRFGQTLRALDGHLAGEAYREIAAGLFGADRVPAGPAWKTHDLRDRTIRLVKAGLRLMRRGYLELLQ